jgi:hypothetical protein
LAASYHENSTVKAHGLLVAITTRRVTPTANPQGDEDGQRPQRPGHILRAQGESEARLADAASLAM